MAERKMLSEYSLWNAPLKKWSLFSGTNLTLEQVRETLGKNIEGSEADEAQLRPYLTDNRQAWEDPRRY